MSITRTCRVSLAVRVCSRLKVFLPTVLLASIQVVPLSRDTCTSSPLATLADRVPETVCDAVLVTKSVEESPVSLENAKVDTVVVGAVLGAVYYLWFYDKYDKKERGHGHKDPDGHN